MGTILNSEKYSMSFTTGGLFLQESIKLALLHQHLQNWETVKEQVIAANLLQARTINSAKRVCYEIINRLRQLSPDELELLLDGDVHEQKHVLWLAICRHYRFIADFASEVMRERLLSLQTDLKPEEFDFFLNRKAEWHAELESLSPSTRTRLRQVLYKMLRESDMLNDNYIINAVMLSPRLLSAIPRERRHDVFTFPVFESGVRGKTQ